MGDSKLVFQGKPLLEKEQFLRDIMSANGVNEVVVTPKNELEAYAQQMGSLVQLFQQYPAYSVGAIVAVLLLVLFIMGE
jgi:hypothetical protein